VVALDFDERIEPHARTRRASERRPHSLPARSTGRRASAARRASVFCLAVRPPAQNGRNCVPPPRPEERRWKRRVSKGVPERTRRRLPSILRDAALRAPPQDEASVFMAVLGGCRRPVSRIAGKPLINLDSRKEKDFHFLAPDFRFLAADFHFLAVGLAFLPCARRWASELQTAGNGAASLWKGSIRARKRRPASPCHPREKRGSRSPATGFSNGILALPDVRGSLLDPRLSRG
jgi:hypothetical protein